MKLLFSRDIYVCACSVGKCVYACHFLAEKLLACCPEKVTELTLSLLLVFLPPSPHADKSQSFVFFDDGKLC